LRFIDLAVAALIGSSAITGIVAWNPRAGDAGAQQFASQESLRDELVEFLRHGGLAQFLQSPSGACLRVSEASNSTFRLYATIGSATCGTPPTPGSPNATLSLKLVPFVVVLVSWSPG